MNFLPHVPYIAWAAFFAILFTTLNCNGIETSARINALMAAAPGVAQRAVPPGSGNTFKDTSMIKPPAGQKVAIYEFEDLECPACARAHPMVISAVDHYKIAFVRRDFPLPGVCNRCAGPLPHLPFADAPRPVYC